MAVETDILKNLSLDMHQGINTVTENVEYLDNGIPILQSKNITQGYLNLEDVKYLSEISYKKYKDKYQPKVNDVLVCNIGTIGSSLRISKEENFLIAWNLFLIKLDENKLYSQYFAHYLNYLKDKKYFDKFLTGGTVKFINKKTMEKIPVPLPPLPIQKRIAEILDTADALRRKDEALLKKYDELAQAIFIDMFGDPVKNEKGWEVKKLKSCTSKIGSGSTPTGGKTAYKEQGISLIRSMNVYDNYFKMKDLAFIDDIQAEKLKNVEVKSNDVLFNITGASVCRCTIVPEEILPARVNQHVAILRAKEELLSPKFLSTLLTTNSMKKQLLNIGMAGGAVMEAITKDQLENQNIILPPIEVQNRFANILKNLNEQNQKSSICQKESDSLFNSLLQKAFNGELVK